MQIDWITIVAQIVNFLVLVWLLNRVLYRPLSRALDERAAAVRQALTEAEAAQARAAGAEAEHRAALRDFDADRAARLATVEAEAKALHDRLNAEAHAAIAARRRAWAEQLADERSAFLDRLRRRAGAAFVTLARNALAAMSDRDLLDQIARVFARRLATLDPDEQARLGQAAQAGEPVTVLSSEPLSAPARALITEAVARLTGTDDPAFRADPSVETGVLLVVGSRHIGWTLGEYLDAFEDDIAGLLSEQAGREGVA